MRFIVSKPILLSMCSIPIHLEFVCTASVDQPLNNSCSSITDVYEYVLTSTCLRLLSKERDVSDFLSEDAKSSYAEGLMLLEYFGYHSLQENQLFLELQEAVNYCNNRHEKKIWGPGEHAQEQKLIGFVQPNNSDGKYDGHASYFFSHLTLRDFFGAKYIADCFSKGYIVNTWDVHHLWFNPEFESINEFIKEHRFDDRFKLVWPFICGIFRKVKNFEGFKKFLYALLSDIQNKDIFGVETACLLFSCLD